VSWAEATHSSTTRSSVQLEHEAESFVNRFKFVVAEPSNEFTESLMRYG